MQRPQEPLGFLGSLVVRVTGLEPVTPTMSMSSEASTTVRHCAETRGFRISDRLGCPLPSATVRPIGYSLATVSAGGDRPSCQRDGTVGERPEHAGPCPSRPRP